MEYRRYRPGRACRPQRARGARPHRGRTGEGVLLVTEKFAFQQLLGKRAAHQRDERSLAPRAVVVDHPRDERLARSGGAGDERGSIRSGGVRNGGKNPLHDWRGTPKKSGGVIGRARGGVGHRRANSSARVNGQKLMQGLFELGEVQRLDQIGRRPELPGGDRVIKGPMSRDDEHRRAAGGLVDKFQHTQAAHVRQANIKNDQREIATRQFPQAALAGGAKNGRHAAPFANHGQRLGQCHFILDD